jgi:hypothetical protein
MDCSFISYAQCEATASGIGAECNVSTLRGDQRSSQGRHAGEYQGRAY